MKLNTENAARAGYSHRDDMLGRPSSGTIAASPGTPTDPVPQASPILTRHRVLMVDVDLVQVNFASFFRWMDFGYNQLLHELGHPLSAIIADAYATPVVDANCNYRRPVTLDAEFTIRTWVSRVGRTSYQVSHEFADDDGTFALGKCTHVWIRTVKGQSPERVPSWLRAALVADSDRPRDEW